MYINIIIEQKCIQVANKYMCIADLYPNMFTKEVHKNKKAGGLWSNKEKQDPDPCSHHR
jgi:hypothetical protein